MTQDNFYQAYLTNQNDFLEHHGILGQKWGIRRFQNKDGSLTPEGRERYGSQEHTIKKGTRIYRIAGENEDSQQKYKYASAAESTRNYYKAAANRLIKNVHGDDIKPYEYTYTVSKDLRLPSLQMRVDAANEMIQDKKVIKEIAKAYGASEKKVQEHISIAIAMGKGDKVIGNLITSTCAKSPYVLQQYGEKFVEKGFDAVVDDFGSGSNYGKRVSELPIIVFDPSKSIVQTGKQYVDENLMRDAGNKYMKWYNSNQRDPGIERRPALMLDL